MHPERFSCIQIAATCRLVRLVVLVLVLARPGSGAVQAQPNLEYEVKAAFLYNFTRFIEWPEAAFSTPESPIIIGVLGAENPFEGRLQRNIQGKTVNGRSLAARYGQTLEEVGRVHLLYFANIPADDLTRTFAQLENKPVLTVGDSADFTARGGMIRFFAREGKIAFEINRKALEKAGLQASSRLLSLAEIYEQTGAQ